MHGDDGLGHGNVFLDGFRFLQKSSGSVRVGSTYRFAALQDLLQFRALCVESGKRLLPRQDLTVAGIDRVEIAAVDFLVLCRGGAEL